MRETWWIAAGADALLASRGLDGVPSAMAVAERGARLSSDRQSAAVLLDGDPPLLLKWRRPLPKRRWKTCCRPSRERKEARAALRAAGLGIDVPAPLAVAERRRGLLLEGAVLLRPFLKDFSTADAALARRGGCDLLEVLARHLAAWHDAGYRHGDCYPKNVLVSADGRRVVPIGAPGAFVGPPQDGRADRRRLRDLAQWAVGTAAVCGEQEAFAFLEVYESALAGPPPPGLARRVRPLYVWILEKKARRVASRPRREPHGAPLPVPLPTEAKAPPREVRDLARLVR